MSSPRLAIGRHSAIGAWYVITTNTHDRRPFLLDRLAAEAVIAEFQRTSRDGTVASHAWVVMPDHVHWLIELRQSDLATCMRRFKSRSARAIQKATGVRGSTWQAGYYDHGLRNERDVIEQARYIVQNPVRKGLVERCEDYTYSWCRWIDAENGLG